MLDVQEREDAPIQVGSAIEVVPVSRLVSVRLFGGRLGASWSGPAGVRIRERGEERWLPVSDPTRRAQLGIWTAALAVVGLVMWRRKQRPRVVRRKEKR